MLLGFNLHSRRTLRSFSHLSSRPARAARGSASNICHTCEKEAVMTKKLSFDRPNRRDFLRTGIIGGTGLVVAQFAAPKELRAQTNTWTGQVRAASDDAWEDFYGFVFLPDK